MTAKKIASGDNTAMNKLYLSERTRNGAKVAAGEPVDAFKDHAEYESVVQSVLSEDKRESWPPNDMILD
jgi:hypothetical protein